MEPLTPEEKIARRKEKKRIWRKNHPEIDKKYREKNKAKRRKVAKEWIAKNPDRYHLTQIAYHTRKLAEMEEKKNS